MKNQKVDARVFTHYDNREIVRTANYKGKHKRQILFDIPIPESLHEFEEMFQDEETRFYILSTGFSFLKNAIVNRVSLEVKGDCRYEITAEDFTHSRELQELRVFKAKLDTETSGDKDQALKILELGLEYIKRIKEI